MCSPCMRAGPQVRRCSLVDVWEEPSLPDWGAGRSCGSPERRWGAIHQPQPWKRLRCRVHPSIGPQRRSGPSINSHRSARHHLAASMRIWASSAPFESAFDDRRPLDASLSSEARRPPDHDRRGSGGPWVCTLQMEQGNASRQPAMPRCNGARAKRWERGRGGRGDANGQQWCPPRAKTPMASDVPHDEEPPTLARRGGFQCPWASVQAVVPKRGAKRRALPKPPATLPHPRLQGAREPHCPTSAPRPTAVPEFVLGFLRSAPRAGFQ